PAPAIVGATFLDRLARSTVLDLGQGFVQVLRRDGLAVEVLVPQLGEQLEDALPFARQGEDAGRLVLEAAGALEGLDDLLHVVPLDREGLPAGGGELAV